jgi:gamma-glutamylcyclotransferase (GGCT)/AIG2-like uncharacterized protein YtfP
LNADAISSELLFVYGALMRGLDLHHYLAGAVFVDTAWVTGTLVSLGPYPGLVDGTGTVHGELYELADAPSALEALDDLEEFDPADPAASLYQRTRVNAQTRTGTSVAAWVYRYNRPAGDAPVIPSGDWRSHLQR